MNARAPILVGLLLVAAAVSLTWFISVTTKDRFSVEATYPVFADFVDAAGLRWKTRVQINGIDVGKIAVIDHAEQADGHLVARVELRVLKRYTLYRDARVRKVAESLLGDFRLDIHPGTRDAGVLRPGEVISRVQSISDLEAIQGELREVTRNVNEITKSFSQVLAGPEAEGSLGAILARVENSMQAIESATGLISQSLERNDEKVDAILGNAALVSGNAAVVSKDAIVASRALKQLLQRGGVVDSAVQNAASLTERLDAMATRFQDMTVGGEDTAVVDSPLRLAVDNMNIAVEHLSSITRKIDEGQGSVGRMVNDANIAEKFEATLDDAEDLIGGLSRLRTDVELRTEYDVPFNEENEQIRAAIKNVLGIRIRPRPDKYYILEATADPRGKQTRRIVTTESRDPTNASGADETTSETINSTDYNQMKFSAQFAKRYDYLTLRFGIIENTGGLGFDLSSLDERLELRFDAFDFDRRDPTGHGIFPRLRATSLFEFYPNLYLQAGLDDPLNQDLRTWFFGSALRFTDDDLKTLLTIVPFPQ